MVFGFPFWQVCSNFRKDGQCAQFTDSTNFRDINTWYLFEISGQVGGNNFLTWFFSLHGWNIRDDSFALWGNYSNQLLFDFAIALCNFLRVITIEIPTLIKLKQVFCGPVPLQWFYDIFSGSLDASIHRPHRLSYPSHYSVKHLAISFKSWVKVANLRSSTSSELIGNATVISVSDTSTPPTAGLIVAVM